MGIATIIVSVLLLIATVVLFICMIATRTKEGKDSPLDDSQWENDKGKLFASVQKFAGSKDEKILGILGGMYIEELLKKNTSDHGFCMLTDKAFYFIGNVFQKKYVITRRIRMQRRINANEMKGIKVGAIYSNRLIICLVSMVLLFGAYVKVFKSIITQLLLNIIDTEAEYPQIIILCLVAGFLAIIIGIVYCIANLITTRRTKICLEFTSETISFPVTELGRREIKEFYKCIGKVQNMYSYVYPGEKEANDLIPGKDKVERLKELSSLYGQQLIEQEEFEKLKREIINGD